MTCAAYVCENLAKLMLRAASDPKGYVYYPDEGLE